MSATIKWSLNVEVSEGPRVSVSQGVKPEAYGKIDADIPAADGNGSGEATVKVQPSDAAGQVLFLLITAGQYSDELTYKVTDSSVDAIALDAPQLFAGTGILGLLGAVPESLDFSNALETKVSVQIIVGWNAIVPSGDDNGDDGNGGDDND